MSTGSGIPGFDAATQVRPRTTAGRYDADIHPGWDGPLSPNGGHLAAMLLRAARAHLARPDLSPRTLSVHFPRPALHGPAQISVDTLRCGALSALLRAELHQDGRLACTALLTCSSARDATLPITATAPKAPPWEAVSDDDLAVFDPIPPLFGRLNLRTCFGPAPFSGGDQALTGGWIQLREDPAAVDAERQVAFTDAWWPSVYGATTYVPGVPTLELTCHFRSTTTVNGPVLGRFHTHTVNEGHLDETAQLWSREGILLAESRQVAILIRPGT